MNDKELIVIARDEKGNIVREVLTKLIYVKMWIHVFTQDNYIVEVKNRYNS